MTEHYPADAELNALSGQLDPEQEVLFIPTGESPYYTSFYRMLYRLLDVARRAGDFRVYKDGELTFGVRAGRFMNGDAEVAFPGATAQPLTNNATNAIYLDAAGTLHVAADGFPDPATTPHLPLATIATAVGTYAHADIADLRSRAIFRPCDGLSAQAAAALRGLCPTLAITAAAQVGDARTVTVAALDAAGNPLAARVRVRLWVSDVAFGAPVAAGHIVSSVSGLLREIEPNAEIVALTAADGTLTFELADADGGTWHVCAEAAGRVACEPVEFSA